DEDRVTAEILDLHAAGKSIASSRVPAILLAAGIRYFGAWAQAIEAAGFDYDQIRLAREPSTDEELVAEIRALAEDFPEMTRTEFRRHRIGNNAIARFGTLEDAIA